MSADESADHNGHTEQMQELRNWWDETEDLQLTRSQWSTILETLDEVAEMERLGDHIDRMRARELRKLAGEIDHNVSTDPPEEVWPGSEGEA